MPHTNGLKPTTREAHCIKCGTSAKNRTTPWRYINLNRGEGLCGACSPQPKPPP